MPFIKCERFARAWQNPRRSLASFGADEEGFQAPAGKADGEMFKLAADENFNNQTLRGLRRALPGVDIVRIQDEIPGSPDLEVLAWCASQDRLLLSHDVNTLPGHLAEHLQLGKPGVGVLLVRCPYQQGEVIDHLVVLITCSDYSEWIGRCSYLPLR